MRFARIGCVGLRGIPCCCRRRELFARAGAAVVGFSAAQAASAKAGQFSKIDIFSLAGQESISSPYQPGGPTSGPDATFGYKKSAGQMLAKGYEVRGCTACYTSRASPADVRRGRSLLPH